MSRIVVARKAWTRKALITLLSCSAAILTLSFTLAGCGGSRNGDGTPQEGLAGLLARTGSGAMSPWSMFGKNSLHTRLSEHTGPATSELKWKYNTAGDTFYSAPAVAADGTVYIGDVGYNLQAPRLYAVNPNGTVKWTYATTGAPTGPAISADGSTIYVGGCLNSAYQIVDNKIYAISSTGTLRWTYSTAGGVLTSPTIGADGTIYVGCLGSLGVAGQFYALNPDGSLKWAFPSGSTRSSAAIGSDGTIYLGAFNGKVYAVNPDGTPKWEYFTNGGGVSSPSVAADGTIYIGNGTNGNGNGNQLFAFNADGTLKWTYTAAYNVWSSPAIGADGTVYVGNHDTYEGDGSPYTFQGSLDAINPDGTLRWSFVPPVANTGVFDAPCVGADGAIYFGTTSSSSSNPTYYYCLNPNGTQKWSYLLPGQGVGTASAIGGDGTVYTGARGKYVASKVKGKIVYTYTGGLFAFGPGTP